MKVGSARRSRTAHRRPGRGRRGVPAAVHRRRGRRSVDHGPGGRHERHRQLVRPRRSSTAPSPTSPPDGRGQRRDGDRGRPGRRRRGRRAVRTGTARPSPSGRSSRSRSPAPTVPPTWWICRPSRPTSPTSSTARSTWRPWTASAVEASTEPLEAVLAGLPQRRAAGPGGQFKESITSEIDQMLNLIYGLLALAVVIALIGIANTLALSVHERTRELGLLRAVGMSRRQLRSAIRWESVLIALLGTALGHRPRRGRGVGRDPGAGHRGHRLHGAPAQVGTSSAWPPWPGSARPSARPVERPSSTCWTPSPATRAIGVAPVPPLRRWGRGLDASGVRRRRTRRRS